MSPDGVQALLARRMDRWTARRLAPDCHRISGGNPLLVRGLVEDQAGSPGADQAGSPGTDPTRIEPGSGYGDAVLACLYRCDPALPRVAGALAILAEASTPALVGELLSMPPDAVRRAVPVLNGTGVLDDGRFRHPAARAAVLGALSADERADLHARAAGLLHGHHAPVPVVARHLLDARPVGEDWVTPVLWEAAEHALDDGDVDLALRFLRLALRADVDERRRAVTTAMLARVEWRTNPSIAVRRTGALVTAVRAGHLTGRYALLPVTSMLWFGDDEAAGTVLRQLDRQASLPLQVIHAWLYPERAHTRPGIDVHLLDGEPWDESTLPFTVAAVVAAIADERLVDAERRCAALEAGAVARYPTWRALFAALRAEIALRRDDLVAAEAAANTALAVLPPRSWGVVVGLPLSVLVRVATATGRYEDAAGHLATPVPDALFRTPIGLLYRRARGGYQHATGRFRMAVEEFESIGRLMRRWRLDLPVIVPWRTDTARSLLRLGQDRAARELATEQLDLLPPEYAHLRATTLRTLAAASDLADRPALLRQAVHALEGGEDRAELAATLNELGWIHRSLGELGQARTILRRARERADRPEPADRREPVDSHEPVESHEPADRCGAAPAAEPAREPTTGPRPTPPGWRFAQMSGAERRVASLAARGYTNRQIAAKLFITVSTVEQHLTRVYRKLQVNGRTDLPLDRGGPDPLPDEPTAGEAS
ncbi:MAG: hypothetical protein AUI14_20820 [Actinobacteria bacterium 13_2_20CM_2_71_6]|nr:MAG: hypothetical protein AUI14_20820 [Actinobacteria bacterium 13_2_20CM_2_71_6]